MIARLLLLDEAIFLSFERLRRRGPTRLMRALTHLGDTASWVLVGLVLLCSGGQGPRLALLLGAGAGLATALVQAVKRTLRRPRPSARLTGFIALVENPDAFSFPSGHTAAAFAIAVAWAGQGAPLSSLTLLLACAIGVSRVWLGAHFPLDVLCGAAAGALCGGAAAALIA